MTETEYELAESRHVAIESDGVGSLLSVGPVKQGERWIITGTSVSANGSCTFSSYYGTELDPRKQIDFTRRGQNDFSDTEIKLSSQETVSIAFRGTVGLQCVVVFTGRRFVRGRRSY